MKQLLPLLALAASVTAGPYNTFDGPGFPACNEVAAVYHPTTVDQIVDIVKNASASGVPVRASGKGHMWYDTMCSDDPSTVIVVTDGVAGISGFEFDKEKNEGSVWVEAGVTFFKLADYLHANGASIGYSLVNYNITVNGAIAMGAHRSALSEDATVVGAVLAMDILKADGTIVSLSKEKDGATDEWAAATCSLGLLGVIVRTQLKVVGEFKIAAYQDVLEEADVLNGDIFSLINPYPTANFWWWPGVKKFHHRYYKVVDSSNPQIGFQNTFSVSDFEAGAAKAFLTTGLVSSVVNLATEFLFFTIWGFPNFHTKDTDQAILAWPVTGWSYDVLIGGLFPGEKAEWDQGLHGYTFELAFPMTQANAMLKRVRELLDDSAAKGRTMTSTYRSGINIKFAKKYDAFLTQSTTLGTPEAAAAYAQGAIMLDWPTFKPNINRGIRYNEPFYANLTATLLAEFPLSRPHWTKNTRETFKGAAKNLDASLLQRFAAVRKAFDPKGTFKSVLGEILGVM